MPTSKTANYQLDQRVKLDKILMDDFDANNLKIGEVLRILDISLAVINIALGKTWRR